MSKLVGVRFNVASDQYPAWGKLEVIEPSFGNNAVGMLAIEEKCTYDLAVQIFKEWELWKDQEIDCHRLRSGRVDRIELAG